MNNLKNIFLEVFETRPFLALVLIFFSTAQLLVLRISFISLLGVLFLYLILDYLSKFYTVILGRLMKVFFLYLCVFFLVFQIQQVNLWNRAPHDKTVNLLLRLDAVDVNVMENSLQARSTIINGPAKRLRVMVYGVKPNFEVLPGQILQMKGNLTVLSKDQVPGTFSFGTYLVKSGYYYSIYVGHESDYQLVMQNSWRYPIKSLLHKVRKYISDTLIKLGNFELTALITVMLYGDQTYLSKELSEDFRTLGLSHVLVASGANVSLLLTLMGPALSIFSIKRKNSFLIQSILLLIFSLLSLGEAALLRATVMKILELLNRRKMHKALADNYLYGSVIILGLINPHVLLNTGFQMSCAATQAVYIYNTYNNHHKKSFDPRLKHRIKSRLVSYLLIQVFIFPFIYSNGDRFYLIGIVTNMLILPITDLFISWGFILMVLLRIPLVSHWLAIALEGIYALLMFMFSFFLKLAPYSAITINTKWYINGILLILLFAIYKYSRMKRMKLYRTGLLCFIILHFLIFPTVEKSKYGVYFLDVGQGNATAIWDGRSFVLIDTGPPQAGKNLISFMNYLNIDRINVLILSHLDLDHYGGLTTLLDEYKFKIDTILIAETPYHEAEPFQILQDSLVGRNINLQNLISGNEYHIGNLVLNVLHPRVVKRDRNENSLVFYLISDEIKYFFPGDIGIDSELDLVRQGDITDVDIALLSHHGSKHSNSLELLKALNARLLVNSAGLLNRYKHPSEEVLNRINGSWPLVRIEHEGSIFIRKYNNRTWQVLTYTNKYLPKNYAKIIDREADK